MSQQYILQVSELTKKVRFILESELNTVWLCGEISNFIAASSGHWYLSLKDAKAQVKCAMFKGANRNVRIKPQNGQQVLVRAKVSLYEPRGDFQLIIEQMDDAGEGLLQQQFEQLKYKLNSLGIFANHLKKPLPEKITSVGLVTSPTGAAIKDMLSTLKRRNPLINVIIYPCLVQGELAKADITQAIALANARAECDVLIVGRGGGSMEDLWAFNEEQVVMAIHQSQIMCISAIGHEIDTTLSDYAADLRAVTPTAAAELVAKKLDDVQEKIIDKITLLQARLIRLFELKKQQQQSLIHQLQQNHPAQKIQLHQQKADELTLRLNHAIVQFFHKAKQKPLQIAHKLHGLSPLKKINQHQQNNQQYQQRLKLAIKHLVTSKGETFSHNVEQLHILSPLATIARGYSATRNNKGKIIKSIEQVKAGENILVEVADGTIDAQVVTVASKGNV